MDDPSAPAVQMAGITKVYFGNVVANDNVSLLARRATIHAVVGENGAGKSTLMGILYGSISPDAGRIRIHGSEAHLKSPADALRYGIGMVPQHSSFIPALSLLDNALLGCEQAVAGCLARRRAIRELDNVARSLSVEIPWTARAADTSVATLQKAEIVRTLYRGANIVILDEPTAMLAPPEADALYAILATLASTGHTILVVTHRLQEVMDHAARVTVLRQGRLAVETDTENTSIGELAALVASGSASSRAVTQLGADAYDAHDTPARGSAEPWTRHLEPWMRPRGEVVRLPVLEVRDVVLDRFRSKRTSAINLEVLAGEILGVAGVDGSGQRELAETIVGLRPCSTGSIAINGRDVSRRTIRQRLATGLAYCPEDRHRDGLILDFTVAENLLLGHQWDDRLGGGRTIRWQKVIRNAEEIARRHNVRLSSVEAPAASLSGGNQQKLMIARALAVPPSLLVAMQPTRGLDIQASQEAYDAIIAARSSGMGVLLFSLDLDELLALSDRIAVMYSGGLVGIVERTSADRSALGHMMTTGTMPS